MIELSWQTASSALYDSYLRQVHQPNLLQSYAYALAIRKTQYLAPKPAIILRDGEEIGFFQVLKPNAFRVFFRL